MKRFSFFAFFTSIGNTQMLAAVLHPLYGAPAESGGEAGSLHPLGQYKSKEVSFFKKISRQEVITNIQDIMGTKDGSLI